MSLAAGRFGSLDSPGDLHLVADACVIGAGAGGAAAALSLAEAGLSVVVLDAGRNWQPSEFQPSTAFALRHLYHRRGVESAVGNVMMPIAQGRGVGGSTLINSAICFRPPADVVADWRGLGFDPGGELENRVERVWKSIGVGVNPPEVQKENNLIFKKGVEALGLDGAFMPRSAPGCLGCGVCQLGCPTGGKLSVDRSLLTLAEAAGVVAVHAGCRAIHADTRGDAMVAVRGERLHPETDAVVGTFRVEADRFVISGGTFGSPRFLLSNGLADGKHCGEHLRAHPGLGVLAAFDHPIRPWEGVTQGYYVDRLDVGYLLETYTVTPDQYYLNLPLELGDASLGVMADLAQRASSGVLACGRDSEGQVSRLGTTYSLGDPDRERLIKGLWDLCRVFFAAGAKDVIVPVLGAPRITPDMDLPEVLPLSIPPLDLSVYSSHIMGTCRLGTGPETSVVSPEGRIWGWNNVHVADASIFPGALGVNPQVTVMAVGLLVGEACAAG